MSEVVNRKIYQYTGIIKWIHQETPDVKTFVISKPSFFTYEAGQYVMFGFADKRKIHKKINIPLSIASSPDEDVLRVTIKKHQEYTSAILNELKNGDEVLVTGPLGKIFNFSKLPSKNLVMISGGSGIVPFMSLTRYIKNHNLKEYKIKILYGNKSFQDIIYREELDYLNQDENIEVINFLEQPDENWKGEKGFITEEKIRQYINLNEDNTYMICGSPIMQYCIGKILERMKIPKEKILKENWGVLKSSEIPDNC